MYRIDYWMLTKFDQSENKLELLGNYIQASKLGQSYLLFSSAIGSAIFAGISASKGNEPIEAIVRTIRLLLAMGMLGYIIFLLIGKPLIPVLYGDSFDQVYVCGLLVIPGIIALMSASVTANYLSGKGLASYNMIGVILGLIIIISGDYFFIPSGGIYAAAIVSSIGYFAYAVYMLVIFCSKTNCSWKDILAIRPQDILLLKGIFKRVEN
jgi:O-antigen/teichoic acid export membrane protein